jgi:hypothetical protein
MTATRRKVGGGGAGGLARARGPVEGDTPEQAFHRAINYFATPPAAARAGAELIQRVDPGAWWMWECACGRGNMAGPLAEYFPRVLATDLVDHGWGGQTGGPLDFLSSDADVFETDWIFTNPPNPHTEAFVRLGLKRARRGVAILTRLTFLDTIGRFELFHGQDVSLSWLAPFAERVPMVLGDWDPDASTATPAAWFLFMRPEALATSRIPRFAMGGLSVFPGQIIPPGTLARLTHPDDAARWGRDRSDRP